jgi:3-hydroxyacyl-CoA dehydrogenase / enoyl-CoA hydratase / 3-hydroxybutyryl-CoA epimerase
MTAAVRYEVESGIINLVLDDPSQNANTMNPAYVDAMASAVDRAARAIEESPEAIKGIVVSSAKKTFFAGGDLKLLTQAQPTDAQRLFEEVETIKATLRKLETIGRPVVAAINGAALGGGLEIALAAHRRIAVEGAYDIGLPEATLGLMPGGGGVTRTVRMFGLPKALSKLLLQGQRLRPLQALEEGVVDELVATRDELLPAAYAWIEANAGNVDAATQPWDREGYRIPGGDPNTPKLAASLPALPARLRKQTKGAPYRAPRNILSAAVEGSQVDFDTATRIESRYLVELVVGQQFKNMAQAFFFDLGAINAGGSRPKGIAPTRPARVAVIGAGMMGAGIA